jgi:excisionase family DNA binding protein
MPETLISTGEAARRLGISLAAMQTMVRNGEIKALRKGRLVKVSEADLQVLLDQKQGRMEGDMTMSEVRSLDEFKKNLVQALDDKVVKQALQRCIGGAGFREQVLDALDAPEVRRKLAKIRKR